MSMHLEGPWLSTTGKRRGKKKYRSSEQKQKEQQLAESWADLQKKYPVAPARKLQRNVYTGPRNMNMERNTRHIPSVDTGLGTTAPVRQQQYTGDKMIGIGTMHKSNMVPIFSDKEARDISTMRRG
jgi:hypothetical protein